MKEKTPTTQPRWLDRYHGRFTGRKLPKRLRIELFPRIRHAEKLPGTKRLRRYLASGLVGALFYGGTAAGLFLHDLNNQFSQSTVSIDDFVKKKVEPVDDYTGRALNIMLLGIDSRHGEINDLFGEPEGLLNDTNMLLHISADRKHIQVISIPRDSLVNIPSCKLKDGSLTEPQYGQFNWALSIGAEGDPENLAPGIACVQATMEELTGLTIDEFAMVDFSGFKSIIDSLGGVEMCFETDLYDPKSALDIPAGCHTLNGYQAIAFARTRSLPDDPSGDIGRVGRQQQLIGRILDTVKSKNILADFPKLYSFSKETLKALRVSPSLSSISTSTGLAYSLSSIPNSGIQFATMPWGQSPVDPNRVVPTEQADLVWEALREDKPFPPGTEVRDLAGQVFTIPDPDNPNPEDSNEGEHTPGDPAQTETGGEGQ
ncbi:cell envelope-like function transcriptional attenuator common domain protein [Gleimia coleocanis DSM 15436]|uniref:Cell envelope-like function transcriptional attenuator common domain protein n=1 Tax=Gleimia coleocanis DSM 15436 TaxID=525245 RepID=C0VZS0_9ACTO|nr:LCP family protein [Gleimia coleocanis]EEH63779.1 cell envelope-like function transcriptional attenuator common domain protein [Gleimia coleocanis DSM 15436]